MFSEFFDSLNTLKYKKVLFYLILFTSTVSSGLSILMIYFIELVLGQNIYKLILISLMFSLPVLILNTLFYLYIKGKEGCNFETVIYIAITLGSIITLLEIYLTSVACYFFNIEFKIYIIYLITLVFSVQLSLKLINYKAKNKKAVNKDRR